MNYPTVSVIINTHNRAYHLKRLLDCLAHQTYDQFEVIVVNGPSTDHTEQVLAAYQGAIRVEHCPEVNLCMSRNIGIRASSGEIVAFIDDDAVPQDANWIKSAVRYFDDETVGIVGGAVYRMNGDVEFEYGVFSIWGDNHSISSCPQTTLNEGWYSGAAGGNVFLRRKAVLESGGFDEYYAYYLDETDLCLRIIQAGWDLHYGENMAIIHEAAKSANRKSQYHLNWDVISKSRGYFVMKASADSGVSQEEREQRAIACCDGWLKDFKWMLSEKKISKEDYKSFVSMVNTGVRQGIKDGLAQERKLDRQIPVHPEEFRPYDRAAGKQHLNLCLFCEDDILDPRGGVPVYTKSIAFGLAARGNNVYVITRGETEKISNVNGVNLCTVTPTEVSVSGTAGLPISQGRLNFSYACYVKLQQLKKAFFVEVAESPIWDSYGVVTSYLEQQIPLATRLQTPLKMVIDTFQKKDNADFDLLMQYESALMERSDQIITISDCVKDTIEKLYEMKFTQPVTKNYLGINPRPLAKPSRRESDGRLVVFFVGRLERRKGIDSIIASIPALMEKYPALEFHLAGDCEIYDEVIGDTYQKKLLKENRGAKWLKRVRFMGKVSDEVKEQEFADCDVFVSPSLYESFGIIFIEAMRYAKPVIGCRVGGMQEVIADEQTGLLCQPGDAQSFQACLDRLLADEALRRKLGSAGRERLLAMFTEEKTCEGSEAIYREMIARKKA